MDTSFEAAITDATHTPSKENFDRVLGMLPGRNLYLHLMLPASGIGQPSIRKVEVQTLACVQYFTTATLPAADASYGSMTWPDILEMIAKMPEIDAVQIVNEAEDWVVFGKGVLLGSVKTKSATASQHPNSDRTWKSRLTDMLPWRPRGSH